jgi:hypothetical protein
VYLLKWKRDGSYVVDEGTRHGCATFTDKQKNAKRFRSKKAAREASWLWINPERRPVLVRLVPRKR